MTDLSFSTGALAGSVPPVALPEAPAKVTARNLNFYYGEHHALKNINLTLGPSSAPPDSSCSIKPIFLIQGLISICCAPASAWCSRSRHPFQ